jgi:hypothetical protein
MRFLLFPLLLLAACSPETPPAQEAARTTVPASIDTAPGPSAEAVPYAKLGWAENRYTWQGAPFTGSAEDSYKKTGRLKMRYGIRDGVFHGLVEEWYENGNKKTQTRYNSGRHEGDNFYWNADGSLQVHKVWRGDQLVSETPGAGAP